MKVATTAPVDYDALMELNFCHTADYKLLELEYKKRAYALCYERYKKLMMMHESGIRVTVTMSSEAGTMTIEDDDQFDPMEYLNEISKNMNARACEIIDLTKQQQAGLLMGTTPKDREEIALSLQAHALCMPSTPTEATESLVFASKAA